MYPILFQYGDLVITSFGVLLTVSFLFFVIGLIRFTPRRDLSMKFFSDHIVSLCLGSFLGTKVLYWVLDAESLIPLLIDNIKASRFLSAFKLLFNIEQFYVLGGIIAFLALMFFYAKKHGQSMLAWMDCILPSFLLAFAVGNIGSFLGGFYVGKETTLFLGIGFGHLDPTSVEASLSYASQIASSILVHPIQLYMALGSLILFLITRELLKKTSSLGVVTVVGSVLFCIQVFLLEFLRTPDDRMVYLFTLSMNQWMSIVGVILATVLFVRKVPRIKV